MAENTKERPIRFVAEEVRALLAGKKTMTRRVVTKHNSYFGSATDEYFAHADFEAPHPGTLIDGTPEGGEYLHVPCHCQTDTYFTLSRNVDCELCKTRGWAGTRHRLYSKWEPGDRLWVREAWSPFIVSACEPGNPVLYRADNLRWYDKLSWKPSIHMPRWASRLTLEIKSVRVERLQAISEEDAIAEGAQCAGVPASLTNRGAFAKLWNQLHGLGSWEANCWVWVISFLRVEPAHAER